MWTAYPLTLGTASAASSLSSGEIVQTILSAVNLGVLGVVFWLFIRGQLHSSDEMDHEREACRKAQEQRDEALIFIRDRLAPLVAEFSSSTGALLPILQGLVTRLELTGREDSVDRETRRQRR